MNDNEWLEFITYVVNQKGKVNLTNECKNRRVGLNTLHRKVMKFEKQNKELYNSFIDLYPYKPRDIKRVDFEQLMRESIITNLSQKELEIKYGIDKRTIQRKFAKIQKNNPRLYYIYEIHVTSKKQNKNIEPILLAEVEAEYVPQRVKTEISELKIRRNEFLQRMQDLQEETINSNNKQLYQHYKEQVKRVDQTIKAIEEEEEKE